MIASSLVRVLGAIAPPGGAGTVVQVMAQAVVLAEHRGADLEDRLGTLWPVPELLRPLNPVVELLDQRLHRTTGHRQPKASIARVVHARLVVLQVRHRLAYHYPRVAARRLLLRQYWPQPFLPPPQRPEYLARPPPPAPPPPPLGQLPAFRRPRRHPRRRHPQITHRTH